MTSTSRIDSALFCILTLSVALRCDANKQGSAATVPFTQPKHEVIAKPSKELQKRIVQQIEALTVEVQEPLREYEADGQKFWRKPGKA